MGATVLREADEHLLLQLHALLMDSKVVKVGHVQDNHVQIMGPTDLPLILLAVVYCDLHPRMNLCGLGLGFACPT